MIADLILLVHAAFVLFVVGGLAVTWMGAALGWHWVRNPWFRTAHLGAICFVVLETLLGYACPLTLWEDALRGTGSAKGFIQRWIHAWLYWDWPAWVFATIYCAFGALVAGTWLKFPPTRFRGRYSPPRRGRSP